MHDVIILSSNQWPILANLYGLKKKQCILFNMMILTSNLTNIHYTNIFNLWCLQYKYDITLNHLTE